MPRIESYRFGEIVINGKIYRKDVIICDDHVIGNWWRKKGHSLVLEDLDAILADPPELLVVGQGAQGRMVVPQETEQKLEELGIDVIALPTSKACETYNQLRKSSRVFAALHLTC